VTHLEDDRATADVAREVAARLLTAAEDAIAGGVDVLAERMKVFPAAYGWWRLICRSAEAVLVLSERGFTVESAPMLRNVLNHAYALHWLVDNGDPAVDALAAAGVDDAEKMCKRLEQTGWPIAAEYRRLLDERKASMDPSAQAGADGEVVRKLKHELGNVYDMLDRYGSADVYPVYSHLSGLSHTSVETASAYLEWTGDAAPQIRRDAPGLGPAAVTQLAVALLQAAHVMSPLLAGDPLRASIDQALTDLGLQDAPLFRDRVR
jgi:hypothetical protein